MTQPSHLLPLMPEIGRPEAYYARRVHEADRQGQLHAHEAWKVGQYITLAIDPNLQWEQRLKYLKHALKHHCNPPPLPGEEIWVFYHGLADLVRRYAGQQALQMASTEDDLYAARLAMGQDRQKIEEEAELFFTRLIDCDHCPHWFNEEDWVQLKLIRDQWI